MLWKRISHEAGLSISDGYHFAKQIHIIYPQNNEKTRRQHNVSGVPLYLNQVELNWIEWEWNVTNKSQVKLPANFGLSLKC